VHNGTRLQLRRIPVPRSYDARVSESLARAFLSHNPCFAELTRQRDQLLVLLLPGPAPLAGYLSRTHGTLKARRQCGNLTKPVLNGDSASVILVSARHSASYRQPAPSKESPWIQR
jgi:hypothetical protein